MTEPNAYERLLLEEIPTGTFGGRRPAHPAATPPQLAAAHRAELEAALDAHDRDRPARHLQPVPAQPQPATTQEQAA